MINTTPLRQKLLDLAISGKLVPHTGEWETVKLGDIARIAGGTTPPKSLLTTSGIPYFKVAEMNLPGNEKYLRHTTLHIASTAKIKTFPANSIVFPKNGGALLTNKKRILATESVCDLNTGAVILHDTSILDYFFLWFQTIDFNKYVSGGVIPTINTSILKTLSIPLPPLAEQRAIVARLEELLALEREIAADGAALDDLLTAARRKILSLAIEGKLVPHQGEWKTVKIGDVCAVARGGSPRPIKAFLTDDKNGLNWIKIGDADGTKYITAVKEKIKPEGLKKTRQVVSGDLLLTNSMSFGHPYILKVDGCIHDGWLVLHPSDVVDKEYLYYNLSTPETMQKFKFAASGGVVANLNSDKVSATTIPLPPLAEQKAIVQRVEELLSIIDGMKA